MVEELVAQLEERCRQAREASTRRETSEEVTQFGARLERQHFVADLLERSVYLPMTSRPKRRPVRRLPRFRSKLVANRNGPAISTGPHWSGRLDSRTSGLSVPNRTLY